jgi:hypothetical protein
MELRGTGDSSEKTKLVQSETVHSPQSGSQRRFEEWGVGVLAQRSWWLGGDGGGDNVRAQTRVGKQSKRRPNIPRDTCPR